MRTARAERVAIFEEYIVADLVLRMEEITVKVIKVVKREEI